MHALMMRASEIGVTYSMTGSLSTVSASVSVNDQMPVGGPPIPVTAFGPMNNLCKPNLSKRSVMPFSKPFPKVINAIKVVAPMMMPIMVRYDLIFLFFTFFKASAKNSFIRSTSRHLRGGARQLFLQGVLLKACQ